MWIERFLDEFNGHAIDVEYPNARRFYTGSIFISHAGADFRRILDTIAYPVLMDRFGDGYFLHSRQSGGSKAYKFLVRAALHWCDKFMLVASRNISGHDWVEAEVRWLLRAGKPLIVCQLDDVDPATIHPEIAALLPVASTPNGERVFDFRQSDLSAPQQSLALAIDELLSIKPYPRFPNGPPGSGRTDA